MGWGCFERGALPGGTAAYVLAAMVRAVEPSHGHPRPTIHVDVTLSQSCHWGEPACPLTLVVLGVWGVTLRVDSFWTWGIFHGTPRLRGDNYDGALNAICCTASLATVAYVHTYGGNFRRNVCQNVGDFGETSGIFCWFADLLFFLLGMMGCVWSSWEGKKGQIIFWTSKTHDLAVVVLWSGIF